MATNDGKVSLASMTDPSGSTSYAYDRRGLLRSNRQTIQLMPYLTTFGYDANGNRTTIRYPSGLVVNYTYDFADRPATARSPFVTYVGSVTRKPLGPITTLQYGNGTMRTMTYDQRYRMLNNQLSFGPSLLASYTSQYDQTGNVTQIADALNAGYTRNFTYDDLNRLKTAAASGLWGNGTYSYDAMGNMTGSSFRMAMFNYSGTTPKLTSVLENGVSRSVVYDGSGNETAVGSAGFVISPRNLLASGEGLGYLYDGRGVRTVATTASTGERRFSIYGPELNLLAESAYTSATYRRIDYEYVWFDGMPVAQLSSPEATVADVRWTFSDGLGTPLVQTDRNGAVWWQAEYEPYGRITSMRSADRHQPLRLPGQEAEQLSTTAANGSTERSYNVFRWYRAGWGRYTQTDPMGLHGGLNIYGYTKGNPIVDFDPLGLCCTNRDFARELLKAYSIASRTQSTNFFMQVLTGRIFRRGVPTGCGLNGDTLVSALSGLNCWQPSRVDAGPDWVNRWLAPGAFTCQRSIPHSFVRLTPINKCCDATPSPVAVDNYFGWPSMTPDPDPSRAPL